MTSSSWEILPLGGVADIRVSNVDKRSVSGELPVRLCNYLDVYQQPYLTANRPYMGATATAAEVERFRVRAGDVLITKDSETPDDIAIPAVICSAPPDLVCGYHLAILRPGPRVDPTWLAKQLTGNAAKRYFGCVASGSTRYGLSNSAIARYPVALPPIEEQTHAAGILRTLDETICKTEQLIAKLKQVKQGLLHDLLTRGIDDNGELRDPERNPDMFRDSPLGLIPCHWDVKPVEELLADVDPAMRSGPFGSALLKSELAESGIPLLGIDNVHVERFDTTYTRFVSLGKAAELSRYTVRPGDVMITIMGTVGRCCVVPDSIGDALSSKHVWTLTFDTERYSPLLACLQFNYAPWVLGHLARDEQGGIMSAIRSGTLRTTRMPVPPPFEIRQIEAVLVESSRRVSLEEAHLLKLNLLKQGLAEDLLSGRVRAVHSGSIA